MALAQSVPRLLMSALETGLGIAQARLALIAVDLEVEFSRLMVLLAAGLVSAALLALASLFGAAFVIAMYWDSHRLLAIGLVGAAYLVVGLTFGWLALRALNSGEGWFAATLAELDKDRALFDRGLASQAEAAPDGSMTGGLAAGRTT